MKKHEIIDHAHKFYPKGTMFTWGKKDKPFISNGDFKFQFSDCNALTAITIEDGDATLFDGDTWASIVKVDIAEPKKIAVRVENEAEFNALMKYYDTLNLTWQNGEKASESKFNVSFNNRISFPNDVEEGLFQLCTEVDGYTIIPFPDFAKEHNIRIPLLTSEDGVELFEGDDYHRAYLHKKWIADKCDNLQLNHAVCRSDKGACQAKAYSTKQGALDWIEQANKPSQVVLFADQDGCEVIVRNDGSISVDKIMINKGHIGITFPKEDVDKIIEAYKSFGL